MIDPRQAAYLTESLNLRIQIPPIPTELKMDWKLRDLGSTRASLIDEQPEEIPPVPNYQDGGATLWIVNIVDPQDYRTFETHTVAKTETAALVDAFEIFRVDALEIADPRGFDDFYVKATAKITGIGPKQEIVSYVFDDESCDICAPGPIEDRQN